MAEEKRLSYEEFVNILSLLAVRLRRLEESMVELVNIIHDQDEFLTMEILKAEMVNETMKQKIPVKFHFTHARIKELDNSFKGLLDYWHKSIDKLIPARQQPAALDTFRERAKHKDRL